MAGSDILGIGTSALLGYQQALQTTSNNISNANTPGYARERVDFATRPGTSTGDYYLGNGVQASGVQRIVSQFVNGQLTNATAANSRYQTYSQYANQVDNLLAKQSAGLQPALQSFYNAVQGVANAPASIPARQELLTQGGDLAGRFNTLYQQFNQIGAQVNARLSSDVNSINSLATQIASLNTQIVAASNNNPTGKPNSLLDQRDAVVNQLAKYVSVNTVSQSDGSINVTIGTGQALVVGSSVTRLGTAAVNGDPSRCLLYTSPSPPDPERYRTPSSACS
ncbi:flagellar hook-associated protein FlgK [Acidihalobacter ferrooxydans]|uniref:Flagellar hook-associated protein 1 n=1 Tax=Acidihalobacter ferrooxydans TaxID=1765967 RepID=A0A1P8UGN7_9GAMM|nr:flagellar hook-associated protein FlgK [Acidihalobacter ferrooxydans]APZ42992.1 flagellar hook-associated protein FlgK [Acidihalobacter ferrooxydans]